MEDHTLIWNRDFVRINSRINIMVIDTIRQVFQVSIAMETNRCAPNVRVIRIILRIQRHFLKTAKTQS